MAQPYTAHTVRRTTREPRKAPLKKYEFFGDTLYIFFEETDLAATKHLAKFRNIPHPLTLDSFRKIGGKRLMCETRQVFPPPDATT